MDMDFAGFFTQLFDALSTEDSLLILLFLFISFLLGLLFGRMSYRRKYRRLKTTLKQKESDYNVLKAQYDGLMEQFEAKDEEIKKAHLEVEGLNGKVDELIKEKAELRNDLYGASERIQELETVDTSYLSDMEALNDQIISLTSQNEALLTKNEEANMASHNNFVDLEEGNSTKNRLTTIEERLDRLVQENNNLKYELSEIKNTGEINFSDQESNEGENQMDLMENDDSFSGESSSIESTQFESERSSKAKKTIKSFLGVKINIASDSIKDDLKLINGIGPFIEEKLNDIGIFTYEQITQFDKELIELVTDAIQFFPGRIERDDWVGQASGLLSKV